MAKKLRFMTAVELAGVGYSPVGGPSQDGVYRSVPDAAAQGWHFEALVKDGSIVDLGEGSEDDGYSDLVPEGQGEAFKASGMTASVWMGMLPVERDARTQAFNIKKMAEKAVSDEDLQRDAAQRNSQAEVDRLAALANAPTQGGATGLSTEGAGSDAATASHAAATPVAAPAPAAPSAQAVVTPAPVAPPASSNGKPAGRKGS